MWVSHDNAPLPGISDLPPAKQGAASPENIPGATVGRLRRGVTFGDHNMTDDILHLVLARGIFIFTRSAIRGDGRN